MVGEGVRRRPAAVAAAARGNDEGCTLLGNTRAWEVHWGLVNLGERPAGGEASSRRRRQWRAVRRDGAQRGNKGRLL
jgi:hypothetical protein